MLTRTPARSRNLTFGLLMLAPLVVMFATMGPIAQDSAYHGLADGRTLFGIPNFVNVATNVGFLVVGSLGLRLFFTARVTGATASWAVFFLGILLVAFGSSHYHLQPTHETLVWDRLPMTISLMALFSALFAEHVSPDVERKLLPVALATGIFSVVWWYYSDDLRFYAWVQFGPLAATLYMLLAYAGRYPHRGYLALGIVFYAIAKVCEFADGPIFSATAGAISGHSLKHLVAALAPLCVYLMLRARITPYSASPRQFR